MFFRSRAGKPKPAPPPPVARPSDPLLSLIVPCYNEVDAIDPLMAAINNALDGVRLEIVFINDGSSDGTLDRLLTLAANDQRVTVINLSRNFGKEASLSAGLDYAHGHAVIPLDADLQDPPELIHDFVAKWRDGYDVVNGVRRDRQSDHVWKRLTAKWFYVLFNRLAETPIPDNVGDFRLLDRRVVDTIKRLPERSRFMKGLFAWVGFSEAHVEYIRPTRSAGETSFNYWRLWNLALDGFVNFSSVPLRVWTYIGATIAGIAFGYGSYIVLRTAILGTDVPGYPSLMAAVLFLGGVQLITLGVIGEYLARLFVETKARPVYVIEQIYGDGPTAAAATLHDLPINAGEQTPKRRGPDLDPRGANQP